MAIKNDADLRKYLQLNDFKVENYKGLDVKDLILLKSTAVGIRINSKNENAKKFFLAKEQFFTFLIVNTPDYKVENYNEFGIVDVVLLKRNAEHSKKVAKERKVQAFLENREKFFSTMLVTKLLERENFICAFAANTKVPFIAKDPKTNNDQAWIFTTKQITENDAVKRVLATAKQNLALVPIEKKDYNMLIRTLYQMGVTEVVLDKGILSMPVNLEQAYKQPDYSKLPEKSRPIVNAELLRTATYFTQELSVPEDQQNMDMLLQMEEDMLNYIKKNKMIIAVSYPEGVENPTAGQGKLVVLNLQDGQTLQPIFTDTLEFIRFKKDRKVDAIIVDGANLSKVIAPEVEKVVLNPDTLKIMIPKDKL